MAFLHRKTSPSPTQATTPRVFENVDFTIDKGEFVCIIGHSGCGKTTILNVLAGLETASDGILTMDGREVAGPGLDRGVVFQSHALMPWLSVHRQREVWRASRWPDWKAVEAQPPSISRWSASATPCTKSRAAVRRHEAARGHRPRLCHPAQDAAAGRALRRPRRPDPRHHPGRAPEDRPGHGPDGVHDHPRRTKPSCWPTASC
jgi:energy-coupling factor transporter ATP-binding protein EcfA2